jgi:hypothetical protein
LQALSKKEKLSGLGSPGGDDSDGDDYSLTPRTEAKYNKIDEEFHLIMQRNQINGVRVGHWLNLINYTALYIAWVDLQVPT